MTDSSCICDQVGRVSVDGIETTGGIAMHLSKRKNRANKNPGKEEERLFRNCLGDNIHRPGVCTVTGGVSGSLSSQGWANSDPGPPLAPYCGISEYRITTKFMREVYLVWLGWPQTHNISAFAF